MRRQLVKGSRYGINGIGLFAEFFLAFVLCWWLINVVLSRIPVNAGANASGTSVENIQIWITSNGVHSDVVVPAVSPYFDWGKDLGISEELKQDSYAPYLAFGWGNEKFFMNTKNWSDLKFGVAFDAAFHLGTSAMHVVQRNVPTAKQETIIPLKISIEQYRKLTRFLTESFAKKNGKYLRIKEHPYSKYDFFFEAKRSYGLAYTCNSWTNDALKSADQKACVWTAFKDGIFVQYESK